MAPLSSKVRAIYRCKCGRGFWMIENSVVKNRIIWETVGFDKSVIPMATMQRRYSSSKGKKQKEMGKFVIYKFFMQVKLSMLSSYSSARNCYQIFVWLCNLKPWNAKISMGTHVGNPLMAPFVRFLNICYPVHPEFQGGR